MKFILLLALFLPLFVCSHSARYIDEAQFPHLSHLPLANVETSIENLGECSDIKTPTFSFNSEYPIAVFVHGHRSSAAVFETLSHQYELEGVQVVCFNYRTRENLKLNADKLFSSLQQLLALSNSEEITILGHSMGGLIARDALRNDRREKIIREKLSIKLVTISTPFAGVADAQACASEPLHWLSLGFVPGVCWVIAGDSWSDITAESDYIKHPKPLNPFVTSHLNIITNEENRCRKSNKKGRCIESDTIFKAAEQYSPVIEKYLPVTNIQVDAGHVEIIGSKDRLPIKLLTILRQEGVLPGSFK